MDPQAQRKINRARRVAERFRLTAATVRSSDDTPYGAAAADDREAEAAAIEWLIKKVEDPSHG